MTSIVTEVLKSTGKLEKENIVLKVHELKRKLEFIKLEVQENVKNRYIDFHPQYIRIENVIDRLKYIGVDYEVLSNKIEREIKPQLVSSAAEFHDVIDDLKNIKTLKLHLLNLVSLYEHVECAKKAISQHSYLSAALSLLDFENVFNSIEPYHQKNISIICALRTEFIITKEDIIYQLQRVWKQKLSIEHIIEGKNKGKIVLICNKNSAEDEELFNSLKLLKNLKYVLKEFGKQFLNLIIKTLICNVVTIRNDIQSSALTIAIVNEQNPMPSEVFENIKTVLYFLKNCFFYHPVNSVENQSSSITALTEFGLVVEEDFCNLIIEECLKTAVPNQTKYLETFQQEVIAAENFCNELQSTGFFPTSGNKLLNFINNVDLLPVNKMIQDILSRARLLMKQSLHQTVTIGVEETSFNKMENSHELNHMTKTESGLSQSTFLFPRCQISVSVKTLVQLLREIKDEAKNIGPIHSPRLYYCARSVCELYCCVVPTFHKEEIQNIPQQTGIYHNNCMYLAHHLYTLGSIYSCELKTEIRMTFVDLVQEIRRLGIEAFLAQLRNQRHQLFQLFQDDALQNAVESAAVNKSEKVVRQCLCQLQLLKKVWCDILPVEVYFKAIGTLLNTCFEEIILRLLAMEDITEEAAAQMDSTFDILIKQGPDLFKVSSVDKSNFIHLYVKRWFKFQELQLILRASMREIVDRWASGKGPLVTHFTAEEVKHLIRALFQNTERRAAALAKIR